MKSPPDGYTVLITNDNAASAPHIMSLPYDYTKELEPVIYLSRQQQVLCAHPSIEVKSVAELIAYVKANPGQRLCDLGRRLEPAHHRRVVQEGDRAHARPRAVPRRRPGDQRSGRRPREDRLARSDRDSCRRLQPGRSGCWRTPRPSAPAYLAERSDARGGGLQGHGAGSLVRRLRAEGHAARDRRQAQRRDEQGGGRSRHEGKLHRAARWRRSAARRRSSARWRRRIR